MPRMRRKSSNLGSDIRGDTSAPAISTTFPDHGSRYQAGTPARSRRHQPLLLRHTWLLPLAIALTIVGVYFVHPTPTNPLRHALFLSYKQPPLEPGGRPVYGKGPADIAFVAFYTVVLCFTREFLMQRVIRPWALWCGIRSKGKVSRFMEQVYTAIYFGVFGPFGLLVMRKSPVWYFNTRGMFEGFPHRVHTADFKAYYLLQASYWAQQGIVLCLQLEKPRKDFKELVAHHIVTLSLIALSYRFHFTYMGIAVYITHDVSDFFLATSKTLNYLDSIIIGPYYFWFMGVWIYLRHYINLKILWAILTDFRTIGPFDLNWETQQYKCWLSQYITFSLLAALQAINLFWLFLILRIGKNYVFANVRKDERSDEEEEEYEEREEDEKKLLAANEGNLPANDINGVSSAKAKSSGISLDTQQPPVLLLNGKPDGINSPEAGVNGGEEHQNTGADAKLQPRANGSDKENRKGQ